MHDNSFLSARAQLHADNCIGIPMSVLNETGQVTKQHRRHAVAAVRRMRRARILHPPECGSFSLRRARPGRTPRRFLFHDKSHSPGPAGDVRQSPGMALLVKTPAKQIATIDSDIMSNL
ncbi:hypothetical protein EVAR_7408_1 [Eumeta japonica]|uniref:Uncharacterized protein n=1 Tax=Eumeta variegata TaxID=151549 RepID=A0A4C1V7C6_EUMVA|nr:hypothetical protein EVAR_7408_1 [Eumeta japonica]